MLNWPMLVRAGQRMTVKNPGPLSDYAHERIEISPTETVVHTPALFPEGALDKVTGLSPWRTWPQETELFQGGPRTHLATTAFVVDDVTISGPFVYKGATKYDAGYGMARLWRAQQGPATEIEEATLVSCFAGSRFFGPFLKDSLPQELLPDGGSQQITMRTKKYSHEPGYRTLFDLPAPPRIEYGRIRRLTFFQDFGQNAGKAARYRLMQDRLRSQVGPRKQEPAKGIYLKRGQTGEARILTNEQELEEYLVNMGFDVVEPAKLPADEVARRTLDAPVVISVEGSHISHVVYSMSRDGLLTVLQPPDRFAMAFKEFTDCIGLRFGFVVGDPTEGGFSVDLDTLRRFLDGVL